MRGPWGAAGGPEGREAGANDGEAVTWASPLGDTWEKAASRSASRATIRIFVVRGEVGAAFH